MRVVFTDRARARLHEIQGYIAFHNIRAASKVVDRIIFVAEMLADHPHLGVAGALGTRSLLVSGLPYRVYYRVNEADDRIEILTVAHTSQLPPRLG